MSSELLDAVDDLTKPTTERVVQDVYRTLTGPDGRPLTDDNGDPIREADGTKTVKVTVDAPLARLQAAITSTISRQGGGGAEKHARNIVNSDALFQFMRITSTITDWCAAVKIRATRDAVTDLRRWYAARLATNPESDEFYIDQLHKWVRIIRANLNPPSSWELKNPCPNCHHATWVDTIDQNGTLVEVERNRPVVVEYWPDSADIIATAKATCRACGEEWNGVRELRSLSFELDPKESVSTGEGSAAHG